MAYTLKAGPFRVGFFLEDEFFSGLFQERYSRWLCEEDSRERITVRCSNDLKPGFSENIDYALGTDAGCRISSASMRFVFSTAAGEGTLEVAPDHSQAVDSLENGIRIVLQWYAVFRNGLIIHAAAAGISGKALLMPAEGGGGKSTIAARCLSTGFDLMGDDLVLMLQTGNGLSVYGLPFTGEAGAVDFFQDACTLKEIIFLRKGSGCTFSEVSAGECAGRLLSNVPFLKNAAPDMIESAMSVIGRAAEIPAYEFSYGLDEKPESVLRERFDV